MKSEVSKSDLQGYLDLLKSQYKSRTALFIVIATGIYFLVQAFYLLRFFLGNVQAFKPVEVYDWLFLLAGSAAIYGANAKARSPEASKIYSYLFNILLLIMISRIGFLYPENAIVFPFYFALGLVIVSITIPWSVRELYFLTAVHVLAFSIFYAILVGVMHHSVQSLPRFHAHFDGVIYILIAAAPCIILRRKRIEQDIENFVLSKEIERKNEQIEKDLEFANRIHQTLIPESISTLRADITVTYRPFSYMGGDYAKFHFVDDHSLIFFICDVTGHGIGSALLVNRIHSEFDRLAKDKLRPGIILQRLDRFIQEDFRETGMFLSAFCGSLDFKGKKLIYSNYGHPAQYIHHLADARVESLAAHTTFLGILKNEGDLYEREIGFRKGDRIFLFTDGLVESVSPTGEMFGTKRVEEFLENSTNHETVAFNDLLIRNLEAFNNGNSHDDILLLNIKIH